MKKLLACLLTLALLAGIVPAALADDNNAGSTAPKAVKALVIGDGDTRDGFEYLYRIFDAEGYEDICLGLLYLADGSIDDYADGVMGTTYTFGRNERDYWESASGYSIKKALADRDWDCVILQTNMNAANDTKGIAKALDVLVPYIKELSPDVKIGYHVNWGRRGVLGPLMYEEIADTTRAAVLSNAQIDFLVPVGTAIMNVQSSFIESEMYDGSEDVNNLGRLIAGYSWFAALTGSKVDELAYKDAPLVYLDSAEEKTIAEAVNNAMASPLSVTQATYKTEPTQYTVTVNGVSRKHLVGDRITITADAQTNGQRAFQNWSVIKGEATLADATALTTTFRVPAQDVEIKAIYENETESTFSVGWGQVDVTPDERNLPEGVTGINMAGSFDTATRISTGTRTEDDRLYVTAIALSDGTHTNVVMTTDFIRVPTAWADQVQDICLEKYGLPKDCLSISATHTHSSVDIGDQQGPRQGAKQVTSVPGSKNYWYFEVWRDGIVDAVGAALADLSPVEETQTGSTEVPGITWVRQWRVLVGDTAYFNGTNVATDGATSKGYFRDADDELQLVRFVREGKKDVLMVNFQSHPTSFGGGSGRYVLSADYCGVVVRNLMAQDEDLLAAYYQGACANTNYSCKMNTVKEKWNPPSDIYDMGGILAEHATELLKNMDTVKTDSVKSMRQEFVAYERDYLVTRTIQQDVITVGDSIAICTAGYEMYDTSGMFVKENSPYKITIIMENSQGHEYMPDWQANHWYVAGGPEAYETWTSCFNEVPGTAEDLADGLVAMLDILYES